MNINLIEGEFNSQEALALITQMIHLKIKYHESKIDKEEQEEDIKCRESKIISLQKELYVLKNGLNTDEKVKIEAIIQVTNK